MKKWMAFVTILGFVATIHAVPVQVFWGMAPYNSVIPQAQIGAEWGGHVYDWRPEVFLIYVGATDSSELVTTWDFGTKLTNLGGELVASSVNRQWVDPMGSFLVNRESCFRDDSDISGVWQVIVWSPLTPNNFGYVQVTLSVENIMYSCMDDTFYIGTGTRDLAYSYNYARGWWYPWVDASQIVGGVRSIPEPTAMTLMALGLAAVGLRRRFRVQ